MDKVDNVLWQVKYYKSKQWLNIRNLLLECIEQYPDDLRLKKALAELYMKQKLYVKAIKIFQEILEEDDLDPITYLKIGNCFLFLKEYVLAKEYFEKSKIELPEMTYNKAFALSKIGEIDLSIKIMKQLLISHSYSVAPFIFLAELYFTKKKYGPALEYLNKAEKMFGKQANLFYLKGLAYFHQKKWIQSYIELEKTDKMKTEDHQFYRNYGLVCEKIGKTKKAIANLLKSIKLSPTSASTYMELIKLYLDHDQVMEAYSIIQHAKRNVPFSISLSFLYNQILQKINKLSDQLSIKDKV